MSLSAIAHWAAAALGADPSVHLTEGSPVVVVRDLVARPGWPGRRDRILTGGAPRLHYMLAVAKGVQAMSLTLRAAASKSPR